MTITPDYIKGYLAALRTVQNAVEATKMELELRFCLEDEVIPSADLILEGINDFVKEQRDEYKNLVDKLNKENSGG